MNRNTYFQVRKLIRGGALNANQERYLSRLPERDREAKRRDFEEYNKQMEKSQAAQKAIAQGDLSSVPEYAQSTVKEAMRQEKQSMETAQEIADAGGFEKWSYGDNEPITFTPDNPAIRSSTGSPAVAIRKNKWNNWEIDYKDRSREFVPTGDERFFIMSQNISANNIPELIEKIQQRLEAVRENERKRQEGMSGFDRFLEGLNDTLIDIADVGTFFVPGIASTAYDTFRPEKSSETAERLVSETAESLLQSNTQAEKTYDSLRPGGRLHGILEYDPELTEKIRLFDTYGSELKRALQGEGKPTGKYALHAVIISNTIPYPAALQSAKNITKKKKLFMRATEESYRFRNIPKTQFIQSSFRSKVVNPDITLVFGKLKTA